VPPSCVRFQRASCNPCLRRVRSQADPSRLLCVNPLAPRIVVKASSLSRSAPIREEVHQFNVRFRGEARRANIHRRRPDRIGHHFLLLCSWSGIGPSRHFAATPDVGRFRTEADLKRQARPAASVANDPTATLAGHLNHPCLNHRHYAKLIQPQCL
jgi:hypothetical protein